MDETLAALAPTLVELTALAREQHMTRAAQQLGVPQPTLSRRIARLEADLGVQLLSRPGRVVRLTSAGRALAAAAERALDELDHGVQQVLGDAHPERGRVAVGFLRTLGPVVMPRLLREFGTLHPGIRVELREDAHEPLLDRLLDGEVDICLTSPLPESGARLAARPLQVQRLAALVPDGHRLAGRLRVALTELAGERFVGLKPGYGLRRITDTWCAAAGFTPRLAFEGDDVETVRGLVAAGLGVALLPAADRRPAGLVEVAVTPEASRTVGAVWVLPHHPAPPVARFQEFVLREGPRLMRR